MRLPIPQSLVDYLLNKASHSPYVHLEGYMNRYWLLKPQPYPHNLSMGARIHEILSSDSDRHFHDHPWWNISVILRGQYMEEMPVDQEQHPAFDNAYKKFALRRTGDVVYRGAKHRHRIHLIDDKPVISLFIFGREEQDWGFFTHNGKIGHREYLADPGRHDDSVSFPGGNSAAGFFLG